jgi:hypothetical protein
MSTKFIWFLWMLLDIWLYALSKSLAMYLCTLTESNLPGCSGLVTHPWTHTVSSLHNLSSSKVRTLIEWVPDGVELLGFAIDLFGQLSDRHAFNMTWGCTANRSLTDIDGDRSTPKTSMPCCFSIDIPSGLHSLLTQLFSTIANIANRDRIFSILKVTWNHLTLPV